MGCCWSNTAAAGLLDGWPIIGMMMGKMIACWLLVTMTIVRHWDAEQGLGSTTNK
jgi:hypothetical protein